jgi:hypothetical protein
VTRSGTRKYVGAATYAFRSAILVHAAVWEGASPA